jgi:hypothetical protein
MKCLQKGIFCLKDEYKSEISEVKVGDQFIVVIPRNKNNKIIAGLYTVIEEDFKNTFIQRYAKYTYSHCVRIKPDKELTIPFRLDARRIFEADLREKYGDYNLYFNHNIKSNSIKRISEYEFFIFKGWIDLWERWQKSCEQKPLENTYQRYLLIPIEFDSEWDVDTKSKGNGVFEYHFKRFNSVFFHSAFQRFTRIKVILYSRDNGNLRFYGDAQVASIKEMNGTRTEMIVRIEGYREFSSLQPSIEILKIIQNDKIMSYFIKYPICPIDENLYCFLINNDKQYSEDIQQLTNSLIDSTAVSNNQSISEEIFTAEGKALKPTRKGQDAIRNAALEIYSCQCALCDINDHDMLQASHIAAWSTDVKNRGTLMNVICLCVIHHRLFDLHRFTILGDYTVKFSSQFLDQCKNSKVSDAIKKLTQPISRLPDDELHRPDPELLRYHNKQFYINESNYNSRREEKKTVN